MKTGWHRNTLLVLAITLHNIPEGWAIGVAFGADAADSSTATVTAAVALAVGIGIQNLPEGLAIHLPLGCDGMSPWKAILHTASFSNRGPAAAVIGARAMFLAGPVLPCALSFAAGLIFVVIEELIPDSHRAPNTDLSTVSALAGFTVMMALDVALRSFSSHWQIP